MWVLLGFKLSLLLFDNFPTHFTHRHGHRHKHMDMYAHILPLIPDKILQNEGKRYKCDRNVVVIQSELEELKYQYSKHSILNAVGKSID